MHLQCHLGLSTLSWARKGAIVTGVDISDSSIAFASSLSRESNIPATFICSDIFDLPQVLDQQFDIVYTSCGVLTWLPDLQRWAQLIIRYLKSNGIFYINEIHPIKRVLTPRLQDDRGDSIRIPYFHQPQPVHVEEQGSYAEPASTWHTAFYWSYSLGEIVTALVEAGLKLDFLHEFPSEEHSDMPMSFSIRARR